MYYKNKLSFWSLPRVFFKVLFRKLVLLAAFERFTTKLEEIQRFVIMNQAAQSVHQDEEG
jgi:hypothetical protein